MKNNSYCAKLFLMRRKIHNEKFEVRSNKLSKDYKLSVIGDIHLTSFANQKLFDSLGYCVSKDNPDFILVPGDVVYNVDDFYDKNNYKSLVSLFSMLNSICPVIMSLGNHDLKESKRNSSTDAIDALKCLEKSTRTIILDNRFKRNQISFNELSFSGLFSSEKSCYYRFKKNWEEYFTQEYLLSLLGFTENKFNILLSHSPDIIADKKLLVSIREELKNLDLIVCAHKHDGLIPRFIQSLNPISNDIGITCTGESIKDFSLGLSNKCRGIHNVDNSSLIVTRGLRKYVYKNHLFTSLDNISSHDISTIILKKKK